MPSFHNSDRRRHTGRARIRRQLAVHVLAIPVSTSSEPNGQTRAVSLRRSVRRDLQRWPAVCSESVAVGCCTQIPVRTALFVRVWRRGVSASIQWSVPPAIGKQAAKCKPAERHGRPGGRAGSSRPDAARVGRPARPTPCSVGWAVAGNRSIASAESNL